MSKAVIFFAPGLEECEGLLCVDILRRAGVDVTIAAVGGARVVQSARQVNIVADALAEELDYTQFDACILPGGIPGAKSAPILPPQAKRSVPSAPRPPRWPRSACCKAKKLPSIPAWTPT